MSSWLDTIPNLGVPGVPGVLPQKSASSDGTPEKCVGVPRVPQHQPRTPGTPHGNTGVPANKLKTLEEHPEHREHRKISEGEARATLGEWHRHLTALDFDTAPNGFTFKRWRQLCFDSWWLYEGYASQLVREGWSAHDVFGVLPWREGGGVLLDRLQGARNLKLDGSGRAFWSLSGATFQTSRGIGDELMSSGLRLVWDMPHR